MHPIYFILFVLINITTCFSVKSTIQEAHYSVLSILLSHTQIFSSAIHFLFVVVFYMTMSVPQPGSAVGQQEHLAQAPRLGRPKYALKIIINKQEYWKFRLIKLFALYSCPSIYVY
jgi:hypothetical protein